MDDDAQSADGTPPGTVVVGETGKGEFQQEVMAGPYRLLADEPAIRGGLDSGPSRYELLLAALGACTTITLRLYADRHQLPLAGVQIRLRHERIHAVDCAECETKAGMIDRIDSAITLEGDLNDEQRGRLIEIAERCPVHRTLKSEVDIRTVEAPAGK
jgi:uncharacterized OsmC-like protein